MLFRPLAMCAVLLFHWHGEIAAQPSDTTSPGALQFLPGTPFSPRLTASVEEPRTGITKTLGSSRLKLDIGAAYDLLELRLGGDSGEVIRAGTEFFTYALSNNAYGLRLQVDAADGYFGGHVLYTDWTGPRVIALRLRILHLSSHFLDGHLSAGGGHWRDDREPIPYSRDCGEVSALWRLMTGRGHIQLYGGMAYASLQRPETISRWSFLAGGEYVDSKLAGRVLGQVCHSYAAIHFSLVGIPAWIGTTHVEAGVRFGAWDRAGMRIYLSYETGLEVFHQYYDVRDNTWGAGIAFDLW
jgi:hypothetical protein